MPAQIDFDLVQADVLLALRLVIGDEAFSTNLSHRNTAAT